MHTIIKIAVVSVLALFAIVGVVSISKAEGKYPNNRDGLMKFWDDIMPEDGGFTSDALIIFKRQRTNNFLIKSQWADGYQPYLLARHFTCEGLKISKIQIWHYDRKLLLSETECKNKS